MKRVPELDFGVLVRIQSDGAGGVAGVFQLTGDKRRGLIGEAGTDIESSLAVGDEGGVGDLPVAGRSRGNGGKGSGATSRGLVESRFEELFEHNSKGYRPLWYEYARELLITWEPANRQRKL